MAAGCVAALVAGCGGSAPTSPTKGTGGNQQLPPPSNHPPVIQSITVQGTRTREPAGYADVKETVRVAAVVTDEETPVDQLLYAWSAAAGTFAGTGAKVTWTAPADAQTPASVALTLKVTEKYGQPGGPLVYSQDVSGAATVSLHDSVKEVGDLARQFLLDFSDSRITDVDYILRNFTTSTDACASGTANEHDDVAKNRVDYRINTSSIGAADVSVEFGGTCAFRGRPGDACAEVPSQWHSTRLTGGGPEPIGAPERADGIDQVTAIYLASSGQWGLCASDFNGVVKPNSTFIR